MAGTIKLIRVVGGAGEAGARAIEPDQLVRGLKACEPWAERALLRAETAHVERLLARMLGFHAELDDLTQEVFIRAFARIGDLREPESLRAWLSSIAVFVAREAIRRKRRRRWLVFLPPEQPADLPASAASFEARNALRVFYEVLDGFAAEERIAFTLRFVEGMELTEVAEACQVSLATIKRRLSLIAQCSEGVCLNPEHSSHFLHVLEAFGQYHDRLKPPTEHGWTGGLARVFVREASEFRDHAQELAEQNSLTPVASLLAEDVASFDFVFGKLRTRGKVWRCAQEVSKAECTSGHGGENRSPLNDGISAA